MTEHNHAFDREELLRLYDIQRAAVKDELSFAYQYLSFYIGLIAAILGATLAGFLNLGDGDWRGVALLAGPMVAIILGQLGALTVSVFYRRFSEAWVSEINLATLLQLSDVDTWVHTEMPFPSSHGGGPFASPIHPVIAERFERAEREGWSAEKLADQIGHRRASTTLKYSAVTFWTYQVIGTLLGVLIVLRVV